MKNKKSAGFKMKKSPTKSYIDAVTGVISDRGSSRPSRLKGLFGGMAAAAGQNIRPQFKPDPRSTTPGYVDEAGNVVKGRPRGTFDMSQGFPRGLFGGGPRRPRPRLYGRPKRGNFMSTILDRLKDQMPPRLGGRPNPYAGGGGANLTPEQMRERIFSSPNERQVTDVNPYTSGPDTMFGVPYYTAQAAPMAKKSGFNMKKGSKPNKSEFFKGKK